MSDPQINPLTDTPTDSPPSKRSMAPWKIVLVTLLAVALLGGTTAYAFSRGPSKEERSADAKAQRAADIKACEAEIGEYLDALTDLDARLDVGLSYDEYTDFLGDAASAKVGADTTGLSEDCEDAMRGANFALDTYTETGAEWGDCLYDAYYCDPDITIDLQTPWAEAADAIDNARKFMEQGSGPGTESDSYSGGSNA